MKRLHLLTLCTLLSATLTAAPQSDSGGGPVPKKLIALGWDSPTVQEYAAHRAEIEKTPFDGIRIQAASQTHEGNIITLRGLFSPVPWKREWFEADIALLQKNRSDKLRHNFLSTAGSGGADLFDDAAWKEIVEHVRIAAWIAREGGLRGILFDPEVGARRSSFIYQRQGRTAEHTFEEYAAQARKRGREMMQALVDEYPDMTFFTLFLSSNHALGALGTDPREGLALKRNYNLYPAFINGWLDAIPPTMTLVDGAEYSYPHSDEAQYLKHANAVRNTIRGFITPENRKKYRTQSELALAIYLDAFATFPLDDVHSDVYNDPPLQPGERLIDRLENAVTSAQHVSDGYVWLWGEQYRWWPTEVKRVAPQRWEDILPGISDALARGMNPGLAALKRAEREFEITEHKLALRGRQTRNQVANGGFNTPEGGLQQWEVEGPVLEEKKTGYRSRGAARLEGESQSSLSQKAGIAPYQFYRFRLRVRQMGEGRPVVTLRWLGEDDAPLGDAITLRPDGDPRHAWQPVAATVRAHREASRLHIALSTDGQTSKNDVIWYDDVELIAIDVN